MKHVPVLQSAVLDLLDPQEGEIVIDVTVGLGGHSLLLLERIGRSGKLIALDADAKNLVEAKKVLGAGNTQLIHANFRDLESLGLPQCDILFADLGLSSPHIDDSTRGFSFRADGPLDCRYDHKRGRTCADLLQKSSEHDLLRIFRDFGEIREARSLAHQIVQSRKERPLMRTLDLVAVAQTVFSFRANSMLPQIFQALRIAVNDEMGALDSLLQQSPNLLKPGGRMGMICYHSLEDRKVKQRFLSLTSSEKGAVSRPKAPASYELLTKNAVQATLEEIGRNPRSRSARLRVIKKLP